MSIAKVVYLARNTPAWLIYVPTNYYQIMSNSMELWSAQDFDLREDSQKINRA